MNDISVSYHALGDVNFSVAVEFVPKREVFGEHFRLKLGGITAFCTRQQLYQILMTIEDAIQPVEVSEYYDPAYRVHIEAESSKLMPESDESYEASEALLQYRRPDRVSKALRKYVETQNRGVHPVFAPILESICPTESDLEQARRRA